MAYQVVGPCAFFTQVNPLDGKSYRSLYYQDALVPDGATDEEIEHNLSVGLIAEIPDVAELTEPGDNGGSGSTVLEEPARNGSTDEWRAYAIAKGAQPEDVADLKRDELVELYGTPAA